MTAGAEPLEPTPSFRGNIASGIAWGFVISVVTQITRVTVAFALARLLTPADYGLAAMAFVCASFVMNLSDASLGRALVQKPEIDELDRSTAFWTTFAIGVVLTTLGIAGSGLCADLFHQPRLEPLLMLLSFSFLLISLQMTQAALFQRRMIYRPTTIRLTSAVVLAGVVGVSAAALGAGPWALIAQQLTASATSATLLWALSDWRPKFMFSWARLRTLGSFGFRVVGAGVMNDLSRNADNMLIGRFLGSSALGIYSVAYNLMTLPVVQLITPVQDSLFPVYARIQNDLVRVGQMWLRTVTLVSSLMVPLMVGLVVVAPDFVHVLLGDRWSRVVPVIRILAPIAILQGLTSLSSSALLALGRARIVLRFSIATGILAVAGFVIGLHWGVVGVAVSYGCVMLPLTALMVGMIASATGVTTGQAVKSLRGVAESTAVMTAVTLGAQWYFHSRSASPFIALAVTVVIGAAVYLPLCLARVAPVAAEVSRLRNRLALGANARSVSSEAGA